MDSNVLLYVATYPPLRRTNCKLQSVMEYEPFHSRGPDSKVPCMSHIKHLVEQ